MTPAEHIAQAEQLLTNATQITTGGWQVPTTEMLLAAVAHALIALAVEQGVPHTPTPPGGQ